LDSARLALAAVFMAAGNTQQPLFFKTGGGTTYACMARIRKHNYTDDLVAVQAHSCTVTLSFQCTDWKIYSTPTQQVTHTFSDTSAGVSVVVGGLTTVNPIIIVTAGSGGCKPYISDASTNIVNLDFSQLTMNPGDTLTIDTDFQTATYTPSGGSGSSALSYLSHPGIWGPLPSNTTTVINAIDGTGASQPNSTLAVQWANAFPSV
jgi:hypothetical protein